MEIQESIISIFYYYQRSSKVLMLYATSFSKGEQDFSILKLLKSGIHNRLEKHPIHSSSSRIQ